MRTRAKVAASHCIVTRVPVEILTAVLRYDCISRADLRAVAGTCRYLRAVASPLLFHSMSFVLEKLASLDVLQALKTNATKAQIVEHLAIRAKPHLTSLQAGRYIPIVSSVLPHLGHLTTLSIPFALLSEAVFAYVYDHPTIRQLGLDDVTTDNAARAISLDSTLVRPPRSTPLSVPMVYLECDDHTFSHLFLKFLDRHKITFPRVDFVAIDPMPTFLTEGPLSGLDRLFILIQLANLQGAFDFVPLVAQAQPSLGWVDFNFRGRFPGDTFDLGDVWSVSHPGAGLVLLSSTSYGSSFANSWRGIGLHTLRMASAGLRSEFGDDEFAPDERGVFCVNLGFARGAVLTPSAIRNLTKELPWVSAIKFGGDFGWEDWAATLRILKRDYMHLLYGIDFDCSLTPTPTVSTTLACSSACYAKLAKTHPSLVIDADLVGGYLAVWDIAYKLNLSRVKSTAKVKVLCESRGEIQWTVSGAKQVVNVEGAFDHKSKEDIKWARDAYAHVPTADRVKDCLCFGCDEFKGDDPVTALKKCPVKEVRHALRAIRFDLDALDARAPSEPVVAASLETFLRSGSA